MIKEFIDRYKVEGVLFNIIKDDEITVVTNKRVVVATVSGDVLSEKVNDNTKKIDEDVVELLNKIKVEDKECLEE